MLIHPFPPTYNEKSKILILGSFPSVKSRETRYYYGHPRNRFWKVLSAIYSEKVPINNEEKEELVLRNELALWDAVAVCNIRGSEDSSIKNVIPNDISLIIKQSCIKKIIVNGKSAQSLYKKYSEKKTGIEAICLPSTSPANAAWSLERLIAEWKKFLCSSYPYG